MDLGAMAMKEYSAFPKAPALLELHHETLVSYPGHSFRSSYPSAEKQSVFYSLSQLGNCIVGIALKKKIINLIKIIVLEPFKIVANQRALRLNRSLSSNLWWLRSTDYKKFTKEWVLCTVKHVLVKNINK